MRCNAPALKSQKSVLGVSARYEKLQINLFYNTISNDTLFLSLLIKLKIYKRQSQSQKQILFIHKVFPRSVSVSVTVIFFFGFCDVFKLEQAFFNKIL